MKERKVNIYTYIENTICEGPGRRFVIWFQGCLKRCKGCCNEKLLRIEDRNLITIEDMNRKILEAKEKNNLEGVTFLGGESILQMYGVIDIAKYCKSIGLSVMIFSGYYKHQIEKAFPIESKDLFSNIDILVDGPFQINNLDKDRRWIGSKNQNVHFFTNRYNEDIFLKNNLRSVEIRTNNNELVVNGWPVNYRGGR